MSYENCVKAVLGVPSTDQKHYPLSREVGEEFNSLNKWQKALLQVDFDRPESLRNVTCPSSDFYSRKPNPPPSIYAVNESWKENYKEVKKWWRSESYSLDGAKEKIDEYTRMSYKAKLAMRANVNKMIVEQNKLYQQLTGGSCDIDEPMTDVSIPRVSIGSESDLIQNEGMALYDLALNDITDRGEEESLDTEESDQNVEASRGHSIGLFANSNEIENDNPIPTAKRKKKAPSKHLATREVLAKFCSMSRILAKTISCAERDYRKKPLNDFILVNLRNVKWHSKKQGSTQMKLLEGLETSVTVIGANHVSIRNAMYLLALASMNKSLPDSQLTVKYVCENNSTSLEDALDEYIKDISSDDGDM